MDKGFEIFVFGYPGSVGGACTELWHTLRLWRTMGLAVTCITLADPPEKWRQKVSTIGCRTWVIPSGQVAACGELSGRTVIGFCNPQFLETAPVLRRLGCRMLWAGCMNWLFPAEKTAYRHCGPFDGYLFQSRYQLRTLVPQLAAWGVTRSQCHHIPGAFFVDEFPFSFRPREAGQELVIGRLCRPDPAKFPRDLWRVLGRVDRPIRVRLMGWSKRIERHLGPPPPWAQVLPPGAVPADQFLGSIHVLLGWGGTAVENWPRIGLEAMAAGVPVVAPASGGWPEMIRHGHSGLLFTSPQGLIRHLQRLYDDDSLRQQLAENARAEVTRLAAPERLIPRWERFLGMASMIFPFGTWYRHTR